MKNEALEYIMASIFVGLLFSIIPLAIYIDNQTIKFIAVLVWIILVFAIANEVTKK